MFQGKRKDKKEEEWEIKSKGEGERERKRGRKEVFQKEEKGFQVLFIRIINARRRQVGVPRMSGYLKKPGKEENEEWKFRKRERQRERG